MNISRINREWAEVLAQHRRKRKKRDDIKAFRAHVRSVKEAHGIHYPSEKTRGQQLAGELMRGAARRNAIRDMKRWGYSKADIEAHYPYPPRRRKKRR